MYNMAHQAWIWPRDADFQPGINMATNTYQRSHLLARPDEGDAVHGGHDGLLDQLPVDERQDEGRLLVARLRVGAHPLPHQVRHAGVHILRMTVDSRSVASRWVHAQGLHQGERQGYGMGQRWLESTSLESAFYGQLDHYSHVGSCRVILRVSSVYASHAGDQLSSCYEVMASLPTCLDDAARRSHAVADTAQCRKLHAAS